MPAPPIHQPSVAPFAGAARVAHDAALALVRLGDVAQLSGVAHKVTGLAPTPGLVVACDGLAMHGAP